MEVLELDREDDTAKNPMPQATQKVLVSKERKILYLRSQKIKNCHG